MTICYTSIWYYFAPILFKFSAYFWLLKQNKDKIGEEDAEGEEVEGAGEANGGEGGDGSEADSSAGCTDTLADLRVGRSDCGGMTQQSWV